MATFLHDHKDFRDLLEIVASEQKIKDPYLVEKDYWIMHCLWGLVDLGLKFELKGGTSLSKGYQCINRFSEDIDIKINPHTLYKEPLFIGKNQQEEKHIESRKKFFDWILKFLDGKIHGLTSVMRDNNFDDEDSRSCGIRLVYKSHFGTPTGGLKDGVLLEIGFDTTTPNQPLNISSWALEKAQNTPGVSVKDNSAKGVVCYEPKHTFVEKLQAVVKKFKQYKDGKKGKGNLPENFIRHYYDLYQLIDRGDVQKFIGTSQYNEFKKERFKSLDNKVSNSDAFKLSNPDDRNLFEKEYNRSSDLYYKGRPTLDEIIQRFAKDLDRL